MQCPLCRKPTTISGNPYRPFCSERCKLADLARWADGTYRIAAEPVRPGTREPSDTPDEADADL